MDDCGFRSYCSVRGTGKGKCGHRKKRSIGKVENKNDVQVREAVVKKDVTKKSMDVSLNLTAGFSRGNS